MKKNLKMEMRSKSIEELRKIILENKELATKQLVDKNMRKLKNVSVLRDLRKNIAKILTFIREKELSKI